MKQAKAQHVKNKQINEPIYKSNTKTTNVYDNTKENIKEQNVNWQDTPIHPYRILLVGGSRSGKTNALLSLISHQPDIIKIYFIPKIRMKKILIVK